MKKYTITIILCICLILGLALNASATDNAVTSFEELKGLELTEGSTIEFAASFTVTESFDVNYAAVVREGVTLTIAQGCHLHFDNTLENNGLIVRIGSMYCDEAKYSGSGDMQYYANSTDVYRSLMHTIHNEFNGDLSVGGRLQGVELNTEPWELTGADASFGTDNGIADWSNLENDGAGQVATAWLYKNGLISKDGDGKLSPYSTMTNSGACALLDAFADELLQRDVTLDLDIGLDGELCLSSGRDKAGSGEGNEYSDINRLMEKFIRSLNNNRTAAVTTEAELRAALTDDFNYGVSVQSDVTLTADLTTPQGIPLSIASGHTLSTGAYTLETDELCVVFGTLEVPVGGALRNMADRNIDVLSGGALNIHGGVTNYGGIHAGGGTITVFGGGTYVNNRHTDVSDGGRFITHPVSTLSNYDYFTGITKYYDSGEDSTLNSGYTITIDGAVGDNCNELCSDMNIYSTAGLVKAIADAAAGKPVTQMFIMSEGVELRSDLDCGWQLVISGWDDGTGYKPGSLTVNNGVTLRIKDQLRIRDEGRLINNGTVEISGWSEATGRSGEMNLENGKIINSGSLTVGGWAALGSNSNSLFNNTSGTVQTVNGGKLVRNIGFYRDGDTYFDREGTPLPQLPETVDEAKLNMCRIEGSVPYMTNFYPETDAELNALAGVVDSFEITGGRSLTLSDTDVTVKRLRIEEGSALNVTGSITVTDELSADGNLIIDGSVTVDCEFDLRGDITVNNGGTLTLGGAVRGDASKLHIMDEGSLIQSPVLMIYNGNDYFTGGCKGDRWYNHYFALCTPLDVEGDEYPLVLDKSMVTNIAIADSNVLAISKETSEQDTGFRFELKSWGSSDVTVTYDEKDYKTTIDVSLGGLGYFSLPIYNEDFYLTDMDYTASRTLFLMCDGGMTQWQAESVRLRIDDNDQFSDQLIDALPKQMPGGAWCVELTVKSGVTASFDLQCAVQMNGGEQNRSIYLSSTDSDGAIVLKWEEQDDRYESYIAREYYNDDSVLIYYRGADGHMEKLAYSELNAAGFDIEEDGDGRIRLSYNGSGYITSDLYPNAAPLGVYSYLPWMGFYKAQTRDAANYLNEAYNTGDTWIYFMRGEPWNEEELARNPELRVYVNDRQLTDLADGADYEWTQRDGSDGKDLKIKLPQSGDYTLRVELDFGDGWIDRRDIRVFDAAPCLVLRGLDWNELDEPYAQEDRNFDSYASMTPGIWDVQLAMRSFDSANYRFVYTPVTSGLATSDAAKLTVTEISGWESMTGQGFWRLESKAWGDAAITYTDGGTFSLPVHTELPDAGFYKTPERTEANFVNKAVLTVADTLWFLVNEQINGEPEINMQVNGDDSHPGISINKTTGEISFDWTSLEKEFHLRVELKFWDNDGWEHRFERDIYCHFGGRFLSVSRLQNSGDSFSSDGNWDGALSVTAGEHDFAFAITQFNAETGSYDNTLVPHSALSWTNNNDPADTDSLGGFMAHMGDSRFVHAILDSWGEYTITAEVDGEAYTMPLSICLPNAGFYSANERTEANYVDEAILNGGDSLWFLIDEEINGEATGTPVVRMWVNDDDAHPGVIINETTGELNFDWSVLPKEFFLHVELTYWDSNENEHRFDCGAYCRYGGKFLAVSRLEYDEQEQKLVPAELWSGDLVTAPTRAGLAFAAVQWNADSSAYEYELIPAGKLSITEDAAMFSVHRSDPSLTYAIFDTFGDFTITATAADNTQYSMPVTVVLPKVGFYTTADATEAGYIMGDIERFEFDTTEFYCVVRLDEGDTATGVSIKLDDNDDITLGDSGTIDGLEYTKLAYDNMIVVKFKVTSDFKVTRAEDGTEITIPWMNVRADFEGGDSSEYGIAIAAYEKDEGLNAVSPIRVTLNDSLADVTVTLPNTAGSYMICVYDGVGRLSDTRFAEFDAAVGYPRTVTESDMEYGEEYKLFLLDGDSSPLTMSFSFKIK